MNNKPEVGAEYRHFKGAIKRVIAIAKCCDTLADLVVYETVSGGDADFPNGTTWVRPMASWLELKDGKPRFEKI